MHRHGDVLNDDRDDDRDELPDRAGNMGSEDEITALEDQRRRPPFEWDDEPTGGMSER